mmetsp:Transcript_5037/g.4232  ORF Transcript_5037/g.4232 Transcript_5037/m.4232 type:complete len:122 (+) Transcript_5037:565-930(+)
MIRNDVFFNGLSNLEIDLQSFVKLILVLIFIWVIWVDRLEQIEERVRFNDLRYCLDLPCHFISLLLSYCFLKHISARLPIHSGTLSEHRLIHRIHMKSANKDLIFEEVIFTKMEDNAKIIG